MVQDGSLKAIADWDHEFHGIADGSVTTIHIATVIPDEDGRFEIELPNFFKQTAKETHMNTRKQITEYIATQPEPKRSEMQELHDIILELMPTCKLWFLDGKDEKGRIVSNPNIGYGSQTMNYANGKTKEFYQIGISANTTGISVYIMGIDDKKYLAETFGRELGKASVTGYCIKFKTLSDIRVDVLKAAIRYGIGQTARGESLQ